MATNHFLTVSGKGFSMEFPDPDEELLPGVSWGKPEVFFTPAFWKARYHIEEAHKNHSQVTLGESLVEEVAACLIAGHGVSGEDGISVYRQMKDEGYWSSPSSDYSIYETRLSSDFVRNSGTTFRYRFPKQKARYLSVALPSCRKVDIDALSDLELRNFLTTLPGIGLKISSWIVRNLRQSNSVAVLDVHLLRAGRLMKLFPPSIRLPKDYLLLERRFLAFAKAIDVTPSILDSLIWAHMRNIPNGIRKAVLLKSKFD